MYVSEIGTDFTQHGLIVVVVHGHTVRQGIMLTVKGTGRSTDIRLSKEPFAVPGVTHLSFQTVTVTTEVSLRLLTINHAGFGRIAEVVKLQRTVHKHTAVITTGHVELRAVAVQASLVMAISE